MKNKFFIAFLFFLTPLVTSGAPNVSIGSAVKTEVTQSGEVIFGYEIPDGAELKLDVKCDIKARFFIEETGEVVSCGDTYSYPNPGDGGRFKILPYDIPEDASVTFRLIQKIDEITGEEMIAEKVLDAQKTNPPVPLFKQVSVRQDDPKKAVVSINWETLEKANVSLSVGCDSKELKISDKNGDTYSCNEVISKWENANKADAEFGAEGYSSEEGILFTFLAEKDGTFSTIKNLSFTFETSTEEPGDVKQNLIAKIADQIKEIIISLLAFLS